VGNKLSPEEITAMERVLDLLENIKTVPCAFVGQVSIHDSVVHELITELKAQLAKADKARLCPDGFKNGGKLGQKEVVEWGEGECPHHTLVRRVGSKMLRKDCNICWQELKSEEGG